MGQFEGAFQFHLYSTNDVRYAAFACEAYGNYQAPKGERQFTSVSDKRAVFVGASLTFHRKRIDRKGDLQRLLTAQTACLVSSSLARSKREAFESHCRVLLPILTCHQNNHDKVEPRRNLCNRDPNLQPGFPGVDKASLEKTCKKHFI
jgi:hypothetical protein